MLLSGGQQRALTMSPGPANSASVAAKAGLLNPGLVVTELADESHLAPYRLRVRLTNLADRALKNSLLKKTGMALDWRLVVGVPGVGL